jgi:hypothetical protein
MKIKTVLVFLSVLVGLAVPSRAQTDPLSFWSLRNPVPGGDALWQVAYGSNQYVVVSPDGAILTSPDATNWTSSASGVYSGLWGITYGNNEWVAVGGWGFFWPSEDFVLTSSDGHFWTLNTSGGADLLESVAYGNNRFVAVGYYPNQSPEGAVVSSSDGVNWVNSANISNTVLLSVTFGINLFVAVGYDQDIFAGTISVSSDGVNWTNCATGLDTGGYGFNGVAYGNGRFVAEGGSAIATSPDGINWTPVSVAEVGNLYNVAFGNNQFVASTDDGSFWTSPDGTNWTPRTSGTGAESDGITYGGGQFVAVGCTPDGVAATILTSPDGANWASPASGGGAGAGCDLLAVTSTTNEFVAVGYYHNDPHTGAILTSPDGAAWTVQNNSAAYFLNGVANGNNRFVAVGNDGAIVTSFDGVNWTNCSLTAAPGSSNSNGPPPLDPMEPYLLAVAFGNNAFVAVGSGGDIFSSPDGFTWTGQVSGVANPLTGIIWADGKFVAVGWSGAIITSPDGVTWSSQASGTGANLATVAYGNNIFLAAGAGAIVTSPDGVDWSANASTNNFNSVAWGANYFTGVSILNGVATSPDGVNWTQRVPANGNDLVAATFGQGTFVVVGNAGQVLQSAVLANPGLALPSMVAGGAARLAVTGKPGRQYSIQASSDLLNWTTLTNVVLRTSSGTFVDPSARNFSHRFYRIVPQ